MPEENLNRDRFSYEDTLKKYNKPKAEKYFILNRILYRPIGSLLVKILFKTPITPNQLTVLSFFFGILASASFVMGNHIYLISGAVLLQLSQILDVTDGMLARAKNSGSQFGAYLDLFLDRVTDFFIISGIVTGHYLISGNITMLIIGLASLALYFLQVTLFYISVIHIKDFKAGETEESRAMVIFVILIFAAVNRFDLLIYLVAIETSINVLFRIGYLFRLKQTFQN